MRWQSVRQRRARAAIFAGLGLAAGAALAAGLWLALLFQVEWGLLAIPAGALVGAFAGAICRNNFFD